LETDKEETKTIHRSAEILRVLVGRDWEIGGRQAGGRWTRPSDIGSCVLIESYRHRMGCLLLDKLNCDGGLAYETRGIV